MLPPSARRAAARSTRVARTAGTSANSSVAAMHTAALEMKTRQSSAPGNLNNTPPRGGVRSAMASRSQSATNMPPIAANAERMMPSVISCRTRRSRPAPIDTRTVISCWRVSALISSRLPTFAHAINRTAETTSAIPRVGSIAPALLNGVCLEHRSQAV